MVKLVYIAGTAFSTGSAARFIETRDLGSTGTRRTSIGTPRVYTMYLHLAGPFLSITWLRERTFMSLFRPPSLSVFVS